MNQIDYLTEKVNELEIRIDNMLRFKVPQRVVCELKKIAFKRGLNPTEFHLPMTKSVLALKVGIEQETLSRAIRKLPQLGVTLVGRSVIVDVEKSVKTVCSHCAGRYTCKASGAKEPSFL